MAEIQESEKQLSFDEYLNVEDNSAKLALIPYTDYRLINGKEFQFPQRRFFILSVAVHVILAAYALTVVIEKLQKTEVIEVEYTSASAAAPAPMNYSVIEQQPVPEEKEILETPVEIVKPTPKVSAKTKVAPKTVVAKTAPVEAVKAIPKAAPAKAVKSESTFKAEPMATISDIEVPALTDSKVDEVKNLSLKEIESDFDKIDESQNEKLIAAAQIDAKMLAESVEDLEESSQAIASEDSEIESAASERLENLKAQKSLVKKAAQEAAGPTGAPDVSAQTLAASRASKAKAYGAGSDQQSVAKTGSDISGGIGTESEGIVRKLEDLRQKPGNPRPQYDVNDRMNGLSGVIVVNAYVTKEGNLTLFRLIQSTGHRNLDRKTLAALRDWKFYPGQEGWVELPFRWDLKGGVQQKPTLLKRL
jgi:TonB family protein